MRGLLVGKMDRAEELCRKLAPIYGKRIDGLWMAYLAGDSKQKQQIETTLAILEAKILGNKPSSTQILLSPPSKEAAAGKFEIGTVLYNNKPLYAIGLDETSLMAHIAVFGRTGSGKTNFCLSLLKQLANASIPFLILDWKRNYRDLLEDMQDLKVYTAGRSVSPFYFQPLIPPQGTTPSIWLKLLIDVIASAYYVGEGVKFLLLKAIHAVYQQAGIYDGHVQEFPNFKDVLAWLEHYSPANARESQWMISTMRTVQSLCYGEMGEVVNSRQQAPIASLLQENAVLELDALTHTDKSFLSEALLLWIHRFRMQEQDREHLKHLLVIEEAHHLLKQSKSETESLIEITLREIRELGQGILLIDQTPSQISPTALANTATKVFLNLPHRSDINTAAAALLLENDERILLGKLPVGTAIVKMQDKHYLPFLIRIPLVRIKKGHMTDLALQGRFRFDSADSCLENAPQQRNVSHSPPPASDKRATGALSMDEISLLRDVVKHPYDSGVNARYRRLLMSTRRGQKAKEMLVDKGLAESLQVILPRGKLLMLGLTAEGRQVAGNLGLPLPPQETAGLVHEFWRHKLQKVFSGRRYSVEKEVQIPGDGFVDLCCTKGNERIAVEIETGTSNIAENVHKVLSDGFTKLIIAAVTPNAQKQVRDVLTRISSDMDIEVWDAGKVLT